MASGMFFFLGQVKLSMMMMRDEERCAANAECNPTYPCLCCCVNALREAIIKQRAGGEENGREGRGVRGSESCSNRLCQPPIVASSFILAICGCTKEREGLSGMEMADGVLSHHAQKHSHARTSSVATNIGGMYVNDCGGEPVRGERPLCVSSIVLCSLRQSCSEKSSARSWPVL